MTAAASVTDQQPAGRRYPGKWTATAAIRKQVSASRLRQGLPATIKDPVVLAELAAAVLAEGGGRDADAAP